MNEEKPVTYLFYYSNLKRALCKNRLTVRRGAEEWFTCPLEIPKLKKILLGVIFVGGKRGKAGT